MDDVGHVTELPDDEHDVSWQVHQVAWLAVRERPRRAARADVASKCMRVKTGLRAWSLVLRGRTTPMLANTAETKPLQSRVP